MIGLLAPSLIAVIAAVVSGGSFRRLVDARLQGWPALACILAMELVLYNPPIDSQAWAKALGPWMWLALRLVLTGVLVLNGWRRSKGAWACRLAAAGVVLNTLVIAANAGHMPQSPEAAVAVWGDSQIDPRRLQNVSVMGPETRLAWFGDVVAEPVWLPRRNVVSIGDILLALGGAGWVFCAMRAPKIGSGTAPRIDGAAEGAHQGLPR